MMTDPIKQYFRHYGVDVDIQTVTVEPLPEKMKLCLPAANIQRFANAANCIFNLQIQGQKDLHYVLGYGFNIIPWSMPSFEWAIATMIQPERVGLLAVSLPQSGSSVQTSLPSL